LKSAVVILGSRGAPGGEREFSSAVSAVGVSDLDDRVKDRRMNTDALVELCDRLDLQAAILAIIGGEPIDVDLYLKTSARLREALAEIERLRSDAAALPNILAENKRLQFETGLRLTTAAELREARAEIERIRSYHFKTAAELREALAENEHLRSTAAELRETLAENERLRLDAVALSTSSDADAELYRSKLDRGMNTPTFWLMDWFLKFLNFYNAKTDRSSRGH
jgi:hypothetical protein